MYPKALRTHEPIWMYIWVGCIPVMAAMSYLALTPSTEGIDSLFGGEVYLVVMGEGIPLRALYSMGFGVFSLLFACAFLKSMNS